MSRPLGVIDRVDRTLAKALETTDPAFQSRDRDDLRLFTETVPFRKLLVRLNNERLALLLQLSEADLSTPVGVQRAQRIQGELSKLFRFLQVIYEIGDEK